MFLSLLRKDKEFSGTNMPFIIFLCYICASLFMYVRIKNAPMKPLRFALFGNLYQAKKSSSIQQVIRSLESRGAEILVDKAFYYYLTDTLGVEIHATELIEEEDFHADVAVSMGGDGTFLEVASRVKDRNIPILGINMGRLGFLADVPAQDIDFAIEDIYNRQCTTERHSVIQVTYSKGTPNTYPYALNEVAVLKRDDSSMISISVDINQQHLTTYQADGLILSTPTGSTGYALSVGGPIVMPQCGVVGLTAVAPHSLNIRPIILPDNMEIHLRVRSRSGHFLVAIDGRSEPCDQEVELTLTRAPYDILVLKRAGSSQFSTLRNKLMWGSDIRKDE